MKIAGKCLAIGPGKARNTIMVTVMDELDGAPHEVDARCWGDQFHEVTRTIRPGDRVLVDGVLETKSWSKPGSDGPPMRFTNFNAYSIARDELGNPPAPPPDDSDVPF